MKRHWVLALAALALVPGLASAQSATIWGPRLRVTPYVGVSPGFSQKGTATLITAKDISDTEYELDYASSFPVGVNVEYRFWSRFGVMAGGAWSRRGDATLTDFSNLDNPYAVAGNDLWMVKTDLAVHLYELNPEMQLHRINASIFAGPIYIHDRVRANLFTPVSTTGAQNEWGLNLGAEAEVPTANSHLALVLGAENSLIFWNNNNYRERVEGYFQSTAPDAAVVIAAKKSNLFMARVGLSYRF